MSMPSAWQYALARLTAAIGFALLMGLIFGGVAWWLIAVLGGLLAWQLANLYLLQYWLRNRSEESPPDLTGIWGDVVGLVGGLHRRKQFHKRRVLQLLREFRRLSAALPDGVVLLASTNEILWFNRQAARLLGLKRKADFGMPIENLLRHPDFIAYLRDGGPEKPVVVRRDGGRQHLNCLVIDAGEQRLLLVRDVTREARLEQMRTDFVANASHELRTPLTVVSGYLDELDADAALDAAWRQPVAEMRAQAERMRQIVEDLLDLSRLESAGEEAPLEPVAVPELLARLADEARSAAGAGPALELRIESEDGLQGSERELRSVFGNLLSNAMKYTPPAGRVTLRWWTDAAGAHLAVADTGPGIAAEHLPRLTERFYRVDRGRQRELGGSGLGLSIVKHGLQRHGGQLQVDSVEGRGSTFTTHFPQARLLPAAARRSGTTGA